MDPTLQADLNRAINTGLKALGSSVAKNLTALDKAHGSQPLAWMKQLGVDLARAQSQYDQLLTEADETMQPPDMAKVTRALESMLTSAFCLQIVTRAASPKVVVVN